MANSALKGARISLKTLVADNTWSTVADLIVETLLERDPLLHVFCLTGGPIGPLVDAFGRRGVPTTFMAHEQACAMACDGFARSSGNLGVLLVTNGPGVTNVLTGVAGAYLDSVPMLVISGGVARHQRTIGPSGHRPRQVGVQDVATEDFAIPAVKMYSYLDSETLIRRDVLKSVEVAFAPRKGPTWIEVPLDMQNSRVQEQEGASLPSTGESDRSKFLRDRDETLATVIELLQKARKPLVIVGGGFKSGAANPHFRKFLGTINIPCIATWAGMDFFSWRDSGYIGNFGILGERAPNALLAEADLLLVLGSRLSIPSTGYNVGQFSPGAVKIIVDIDEEELHKNTSPVDFGILDDLGEFVPALLSLAQKSELPSFSDWADYCQRLKEALSLGNESFIDEPDTIDVYRFSEALSSALQNDDYAICVDMGTACTALVQSFRHNGMGKLIRAHGLSAMGYAIPASIGVAKSNPSPGTNLAIAGDGAMQLNIQELQVIADQCLAIKIFCLNSNGYRAIEIMQDNLFSGRRFGSDSTSGLPSPNFVALSKAFGINALSLSSLTELELLLESDLYLGNDPLFVNIQLPKKQRHRPRVINRRNDKGEIVSPGLSEMWPSA